jgi:pyridine nucleotide-disulfide oxidoreductase family protein
LKRLLLVGAGHAHAQVLRDWIDAPPRGIELVVVSPSSLAPYSGMVPGWLAGLYRYDEICIDFAALAAAAGARLIVDELVQLDPDLRRVRLRSGLAVDYDVLSLNVGSTLNPPQSTAARVLCLRPLGALHQAWNVLLDDLAHGVSDTPLTVTAVGGGAAGAEALLAALQRLRLLQPGRPIRAELVSRAATLLEGLAPAAVAAAHAALAAAAVAVRLGTDFSDPTVRPGEVLLWATGAEAHAWQRSSGLTVSARGFICVDRCLRSVSHPQVHAAGDCAEWAEPLPKAGVYAVRMGPVLGRNLRAALASQTPQEFVPQRRFLMLLSTGNGRAIASWGRWSAQGRWVWRWKDRVDRGFLRRFEVTDRDARRSSPSA